jgi:hypothetical protein
MVHPTLSASRKVYVPSGVKARRLPLIVMLLAVSIAVSGS